MELDVDDELYDRLTQRAEQTGFESPEEYSVVVLRTVLEEVQDDRDDAVAQRLEDLGYL